MYEQLSKSGQSFRFVAGGTDNSTPAELLRFSWRVNGKSWQPPQYSRALLVGLQNGSHTVEVRAVDLHGNEDLSPASVSFDVDGVQPTLTVTSAPSATTQIGPAQVAFSVSDDRSPPQAIGVQVKVTHQPAGGGAAQVLRDDPFNSGLSSVEISGLAPGTYTVRLAARDEAGNSSTPTTVSFDYQSPGGPAVADGGAPFAEAGSVPQAGPDDVPQAGEGCACRAADAPSTGGWWLLLLVAWIVLRRRR